MEDVTVRVLHVSCGEEGDGSGPCFRTFMGRVQAARDDSPSPTSSGREGVLVLGAACRPLRDMLPGAACALPAATVFPLLPPESVPAAEASRAAWVAAFGAGLRAAAALHRVSAAYVRGDAILVLGAHAAHSLATAALALREWGVDRVLLHTPSPSGAAWLHRHLMGHPDVASKATVLPVSGDVVSHVMTATGGTGVAGVFDLAPTPASSRHHDDGVGMDAMLQCLSFHGHVVTARDDVEMDAHAATTLRLKNASLHTLHEDAWMVGLGATPRTMSLWVHMAGGVVARLLAGGLVPATSATRPALPFAIPHPVIIPHTLASGAAGCNELAAAATASRVAIALSRGRGGTTPPPDTPDATLAHPHDTATGSEAKSGRGDNGGCVIVVSWAADG